MDFETPVREAFTTFATFIPKLLGFLVILLVGYFIAKLVAKLVDKVLERVGFDSAVEKGGIKKAMAKSKYDASDIVAKLVFFAVFIPFLSAAVGALGIAALQEPLAAFIALIPRIIVAIVLVVIGAVIAGTVKSFIENALGGLSYGKVLANVKAQAQQSQQAEAYPAEPTYSSAPTGRTVAPASDAPTATYGTSTRR